jgi:hypothetical protein
MSDEFKHFVVVYVILNDAAGKMSKSGLSWLAGSKMVRVEGYLLYLKVIRCTVCFFDYLMRFISCVSYVAWSGIICE